MTITLLAPDGVPTTAQQERQAKAALYGGGSGRQLGGRSGFRVGTPADTLTATSTTWTLKPCAAMIDPGASTHQGMYGWASDANITGAVTPADATNARKDIVYIQVNDSTAGDASGEVTANVKYLAGAADGLNNPPALPPRSFLVGTIPVPKFGTGSPTVILNPARFAAAGAPLPVYSPTERDAIQDKYDGLAAKRMDLPGRPDATWDGAVWNGVEFSPVNTGIDALWAYKGGLWKETTGAVSRVRLNLLITRASGASTVALTTAETQAFAGLIPATLRPAYSVPANAIIAGTSGTVKYGAVVRVDKDGNVFIKTDLGSTSVQAGEKLPITMEWLL